LVEQFFASLSKRQTMLLLTSVTFGGNESVECFEHLPDEDKELLTHRAKGLLEIPRDKRIPVLVAEIKRIITARRKQLGSAEPQRLAKVLSGERGALIEVVLKALPETLAEAVRKDLGPRTPVKLKREVRQDVLSIVRWKLEDALKAATPKVGLFKFSDLLTLQQRELLTICDRMGARALATALAGLTDEEQAKLFGALPPDQRSLAQRASEGGKARKLTEGDSRTVLEMYGAMENPSAGMRSAGAQRLARACIAHGADFAVKLIERHPGELGKLLSRWVKEERNRPIRGDGGRADIVEQMERLAQKGVIDRPMRLPPPPMAQRAPGGGAVLAAMPARKSLVMQPLGTSNQRALDRGPVPQKPSAPRRSGSASPKPRRDFMAERNARAAGVVSSRVPGGERSGSVDPRLKASAEPSVSNSQPVRVLRDGKPMERQDMGARAVPGLTGKAMTSPALQPIPRRKDRPGGRSGRGVSGFYRPSPVLKGEGGDGNEE
jgi:flagellar motor switch protein FliG